MTDERQTTLFSVKWSLTFIRTCSFDYEHSYSYVGTVHSQAKSKSLSIHILYRYVHREKIERDCSLVESVDKKLQPLIAKLASKIENTKNYPNKLHFVPSAGPASFECESKFKPRRSSSPSNQKPKIVMIRNGTFVAKLQNFLCNFCN